MVPSLKTQDNKFYPKLTNGTDGTDRPRAKHALSLGSGESIRYTAATRRNPGLVADSKTL